MDAGEWSKIITVFIACSLKPGLIGLPTAILFKFSFLKTLVISSVAGICGSIVFSFLSKEIVILYEWFMNKYFPNRKKKKFSWMNRFIIKAKKYFGIAGIAIISPLFLSIPLGCFLAVRFFGDRHKTVLYMSISSVAWTVVYMSFTVFFRKG